jgi:hypothetical protein
VGILTDGKQSSYLDKSSDDARSETRQTLPFTNDPSFGVRNFKISLNNVSEVVNHGT